MDYGKKDGKATRRVLTMRKKQKSQNEGCLDVCGVPSKFEEAGVHCVARGVPIGKNENKDNSVQ